MANEFKIRKGLIVTGASGGTVVNVLGSQGQLLSVTDNLSGSIFAVSDISGVPIFDVNSSGLSTFDGPLTGVSATFTGNVTVGTGIIKSSIGGDIAITQGAIGLRINDSASAISPTTASANNDNAVDLGVSNIRFKNLYLGGSITSEGDITLGNDLNFTTNGFADISNTGTGAMRFKPSSQTLALTLTGANAAIAGKGTSSATITSDGSSTLTTKGYVDSLITGATIYRGTWDPDVSLNSGYGNPNLNTVTQTSGYYYICSADGSATPNGATTEPNSWNTGDWVIWNDDIGTSGEWQKIDNSSVLSGVGTGQTVALWEGAGSVTDSETLGNAPITVSGNNVLVSAGLQLIRTSDPFIQFYEGSTNVGDVFADTSLNNLVLRGASSHGVRIMSNSAADNSETGITLDTSYNVGIGTTSPQNALHIKKEGYQLKLEDGNTANTCEILASNNTMGFFSDRANAVASSDMIFSIDNDTKMKIDSSGQITNTMSGGKVLTDTNGFITSFQTLDTATAGGRFIGKSNRGVLGSIHIEQTTTGADGGYIGFETSPNGSTTPIERMRIDSAGRVGIGVTPKSWTIFTPIQIGQASSFVGRISSNQTDVATNWYYDGAEKRIASGYAQRYTQTAGGEHQWFTAGTDNADSTITFSQKLTIKNNGNVGIGTTSPGRKLQVEGGDFYTNDKSDTVGASVGYGGNSFQIRNGSTSEDLNFDIFNRTTSAWGTPLIIKNTGNVGIGTSTPLAKLDIQGTQGQLFSVTDDLSGSIFAVSDISGVPIFDVNSSGVSYFDGDVGIGTTSPDNILHIETAAAGGPQIQLESTSGTAAAAFINFDSTNLQLSTQRDMVDGTWYDTAKSWGGINIQGPAGGSFITFQTAAASNTSPTERMRIATDGNVGIGTTSPDALLEISGNAGADPGPITNPTTFRITDAGNAATGAGDVTNPWGKIEFYSEDVSSTGPSVQAQIASVYNTIYSNSSDLNFYTRANPAVPLSSRMTIEGGGNVGIGTTSPGAKLEVFGTGNSLRLDSAANGSKEILFRNVGTGTATIKTDGDLKLFVEDAGKNILFSTTGGEKMRILANGNVGIGTTSPGQKLHVNDGSTVTTTDANNMLLLTRNNHSYIMFSCPDEKDSGLHFHNTTDNAFVGRIAYSHESAGDHMLFTVNNSVRMDINYNGDVRFNSYGAGTLVSDAAGNITVSSGGGAGGPFLPLAGGTMTGTSGIEFPEQFKLKWKNSTTSTEVFSITSAGGTNSITSGDGTNSIKTKFFVGDGGLELNSNDPSARIGDFGYSGVSLRQSGVEQLSTTSSGISVKGGDKGQPGYTFIGDTNTGMYSDTADQLDFATGGNIGMVIDSSSNVGIGTTSPSDKLDILTTTGPQIRLSRTSTNYSTLYSDSAGGLVISSYSSGTSNYQIFSINSSEKVRIINNGNVGIGLTNPSAKLHVDGNSYFEDTISIASSSSYAYLNIITSDAGNGNSGQGLMYLENTNAATSGGAMVLALRNNYGTGFGNYIKFFKTGGTTIGEIYANSGRTNLVYSTSSDYRLKEDLKTFKAVDIINQIPVYDFKWKETDFRDYGVLAHEMQAVLPGLVKGDKDGEENQTVDYMAMVPILMQSIKELKAEIELLKQNK